MIGGTTTRKAANYFVVRFGKDQKRTTRWRLMRQELVAWSLTTPDPKEVYPTKRLADILGRTMERCLRNCADCTCRTEKTKKDGLIRSKMHLLHPHG